MSKTAIIATSTGCLDYLDLTNENLRIWRMKILVNDNTYNDFTEMTAERFYDMLKKNRTLVPSSSMPSMGELLDLLDDLEEKGFEEVLIITISSQLSGTYGITVPGLKLYDGKMDVRVLDSRNAAISEGYLSLEALRLIEEGKKLDDIIPFLEKLRLKRKQYFMVDNLRLFVANGRLSGAQGFIGSMLKIKPILEVNDEGKIVPFEKIRTTKKSLARMVDVVLEGLKDVKEFIITYDTSDNIEGLEYVKARIEEAHPGYTYYEAPITPVIGCHTGVGTVGIAFFDTSK